MTFTTRHLTLLLASGLLLSGAVQAQEEEFMPAVAAKLGTDAYKLQLGMGYWNYAKNEHGQLYISRFQAKDELAIDDVKQGKHNYSSTRIGMVGSGFNMNKPAYELGFFLYKNKSDVDINRSGLGFTLGFGKMLNDKIKVHVAGDLMPEQLSTDWQAKAYLEYEFSTALTYRITKQLDVNAGYYYGAVAGKRSIDNYSQGMLGLAFRM
ncbi:MAG: hypothetical protein WAO12_00695 [Venatoribacter sp.]